MKRYVSNVRRISVNYPLGTRSPLMERPRKHMRR
jgi:hypothetical protein